MTDATTSIASQHQLIKQIAFPKIVLPTAATVAGVVGFAFGLIPLVAIMLFSLHRVTPYLLLIPVVAAVQFVFTLAFAYLVAAGNVFFRDLGNVLRHLLRLWFYLSPGLYSLDPRRGQPAGPVPVPAHAPRAQPVRHPLRGVPRAHLGHPGDRPAGPADLVVAGLAGRG